ncbi:CWF19-like protein 2 [Cajanus cajan]|uniref:CWF19-like protein 2 n=1 Tax=Cajanus cajan TaxID=3821 RepID=A0A151U7T1_CAJCA|nr:CWF19-like protein 2 [Cajanus cajan]KYP75354.1 CWF19-like protein 2 [Cajanus cajan]
MLSGVKFIPRDQVHDEDLDSISKERKKSDKRRGKSKRKGRSSRNSSDDDDELDKIKKGSRKKKWYSSEEDSSFYTTESESEQDEKKRRRKAKKKRDDGDSGERSKGRSRSMSGKKEYTSEDEEDASCSSDGSDSFLGRQGKRQKSDRKYGSKRNKIKGEAGSGTVDSTSEMEIARKEMGLDWMLRSESKRPAVPETEELPEEVPVEESKKVNPKELNPYLKDNGCGYPEESDGAKVGAEQLLSSSLVGDGGASWRLKALKRAQEQAAREGRNLHEVVEERWGSVGDLTVSVASHTAAPARAHLCAIKNRQRGITEENSPDSDKLGRRDSKRDYLKDVSVRRHEMKAPKVQDSLSWGKRKSQQVVAEGAGVISAAVSSLNKFTNDGSFMHDFGSKMSKNSDSSVLGSAELEKVSLEAKTPGESSAIVKNEMSANQLAAKAMQLRLKGKHEEAEKLMQEAKVMNTKQGNQDHTIRSRTEGGSRRYAMQKISADQKKGEDDADMHLARKIMQNKQFRASTQADDEYDFEDGPSRKSRKKQGGDDHKSIQNKTNRFLTQQERCLFCLENPNRPMHLVVSIANFTYLMLPKWQPVVPGHCCILPIQHESATRSVDDNVWTEIRNFKKCLIMMFAKQEKEVVFLETVMGLAQQRHHCMVECVPLPQDIAKEAPLYFKKAIDEAEDEWSQHNAKKLIDTSQKGLRNSIPKHFPYFHVEFGLNKGFVHVIDDEKQFNSSLGLNVLRGMLHLAEEDMYRRRRYDAVEVQKQAVATFSKEWNHFDWTKQLHEAS